jgi:hypothetical protein
MTILPDREKAFEAKFARDEEVRFKATVLRNKLLADWAARKLGLVGPDAELYAKRIVAAELENPHPDSVFDRIRADFDANGIAQSDHQIRRTMDTFMVQALTEIKEAC